MSTIPWRDEIHDPEEVRLFGALEDPQWDWRSIPGLERETGLKAEDILRIAEKYPQYIRTGESKSKGTVFQFVDRHPSGTSLKERLLDSLTYSRARMMK